MKIRWIIALLPCFAFSLLIRQNHLGLKRYKHEIALCTMFKNEAPNLKEWIDYHHNVLGVSHFYLYNNESHDHYKEVLAPYVQRGLVEVIDWKCDESSMIDITRFRGEEKTIVNVHWVHYQVGAFNDCMHKRAQGQVKWLGVIDVDEYIVPPEGAKAFKKMVKNYGTFSWKKWIRAPFKKQRPIGCMKIHWMLFGTSNVWDLKAGESFLTALTRRAPENHKDHHYGKCIYRPEAVETCFVHHARLHQDRYRFRDLLPSLCHINHYWTGTAKRLSEKRKLSPEENQSISDEFNVVEDRTILNVMSLCDYRPGQVE